MHAGEDGEKEDKEGEGEGATKASHFLVRGKAACGRPFGAAAQKDKEEEKEEKEEEEEEKEEKEEKEEEEEK